jgi:anti-sigma B factor antagonist
VDIGPERRRGLFVTTSRPQPGTLVVVITGELDIGTRERLIAALAAEKAEEARLLVLDLRELEFMDSSGLRFLIETWKLREESGRPLALLIAETGLVNRVFEVSGCDEILPVVRDLDSAMGATA